MIVKCANALKFMHLHICEFALNILSSNRAYACGVRVLVLVKGGKSCPGKVEKPGSDMIPIGSG